MSPYSYVANNFISGYLPPGCIMLGTTLLKKERVNVKKLLEPIRGTWKGKQLSILSDGRTDSQKRPLINFMGCLKLGQCSLRQLIMKRIQRRVFSFNIDKGVY